MNLGIIGNGFIVGVLLEALKETENVFAKSILVRENSLEKGKELGRKYGIESVYYDFDEFLENSDVDTVYIGIVNSLHFEYAKKCLESGKNVICEKPFTKTFADAEKLFEIAEEMGVYLFEAITTIHMPMFKKVKENINKIGNLKIVNCSFCQYSSRYDDYLKGKIAPVFKKELFGGANVDLNIYNIHFNVALFGLPKSITALANYGENGVDTSGVVLLDYGNFKSVCICAKDSGSPSYALVQGEKGFIKINSALNECSDFFIETKEESFFVSTSEKHSRMYYEMKEFERIINEDDIETYKALKTQSLNAMKVLQNVYELLSYR